MSSVGDTEVFIPEQACVITMPVHSLPSSITRKMSACPVQSDQPATLISPVELREKGTTRKPRPLTPGQFLLPVVTSNHNAFTMLRKFLLSGENSLQFSGENSRAGFVFSKRKNSIVLFDTQVFLIVKKHKASDWPLEQRSSTPSEIEAPPLTSPVETQDGGSDITQGQSKETTRDAEAHGKYAEKPCGDGRDAMACDAKQHDDITDKKRRKDSDGAAEDHGKRAEALKEREADLMKDREEKESRVLMRNVSTNTPSSRVLRRGVKLEEGCGVSALGAEAQSLLANADDCQIAAGLNVELGSESGCANETGLSVETRTRNGESQRKSDEKTESSESSLAKAVQCLSPTNVNQHQDKSDVKDPIKSEIHSDKTKPSVSAAEVGDGRDALQLAQKLAGDASDNVARTNVSVNVQVKSHCESAVEIVDITDTVSSVSSDDENAVGMDVRKVENLLEKCESLNQRIHNFINCQDSMRRSDDVAVETGAECDDLIIVESCSGVENVKVRRDTEVVEVDGPNRHVSSAKRHANRTSARATREDAVCKVAEAKGNESGVEIIDVDEDQELHKSKTDVHQDATGWKNCSDAKSPEMKDCDTAVEIVDLNDSDEVIVNNRAIANRCGDVAKGCKRRLTYETNSDAAPAAAQTRDANGSPAKRCKPSSGDDANDCKRLERALEPDSQAKKHDVEIIEVDDDDDDDDEEIRRSANDTNRNVTEAESCTTEANVRGNRGNVEESSGRASSHKHDGEISDLCARRGDGTQSQSSMEKTESWKRRVHESETEDSSAKCFQSVHVTNPGVKISEKCDEDDLTNNSYSSKAHVHQPRSLFTESDVEIMAGRESRQVSRESPQEPNQDVTNSNVNKASVQTLSAECLTSELQSSFDKNKSRKGTSEMVDVRDDDRSDDTKQTVTDVGSCVKCHIRGVRNQRGAETVETSDGQKAASSDGQNSEVINEGMCVESCVTEVTSAAEDGAVATEGYSDEPDRGVTASEGSGVKDYAEDAAVEEEDDVASASITDEPEPYGTTSESRTERPADAADEVAASKHRESDPETRALQLHRDSECADKQMEATNQSARGDEVAALPRPTSRVSQEFDYMGLWREENINLIRAKIRGMEEQLNILNDSHH